jgi:hypothetical protein
MGTLRRVAGGSSWREVMGFAGKELDRKLCDFHLDDVGRVVASVMLEHPKTCGCEYPPDAYGEVMGSALVFLRKHIGDELEKREIRRWPQKESKVA